MNPHHGEVWLVDMGMAAKTRPAVILLAENLNAPRSLIIHIPITTQSRGSELEVPLSHFPFSTPDRSLMFRVSALFLPSGLKNDWALCLQPN
ncbi:MAG TPA: type II toxin-antitoxin system PemK/MazF family toxin [Verrucomicrobiae bacterium]|jgi:mRNA-degrading endonuclease toxin of MazEF toxin-antitoxin module|nr:type II toxin-antitoxin system PemK/MazF family toxin [Verrucomicrobiae bacterium]